MDRNNFLNAIIDDGIYEITISYTRLDQKIKREGAIKGFEDCRGKTDAEILILRDDALIRTEEARRKEDPNYWGVRYYELQIEWVLNVLSAAYYNQGLPVLVNPTHRGLLKAADILGVKESATG